MTKNFKLYFDNQHYVGEKRFDTVQDLVADGLITFYLESKAADYIAALSSQSNYAESPYVAYNTQKWQMATSGQRRPPRLGTSAQPIAHPEAPSSSAAVATTAPGESLAGTGGSRSSSETGTSTGTAGSGSGSAESASGQSSVSRARGANLPIEKTRLSQIAEARRCPEGQRTPPYKIPHGEKLPLQSFPGTPQLAKQQQQPRASQLPSRASANVAAPVVENSQTDSRVTSSTNTEGPVRIYCSRYFFETCNT